MCKASISLHMAWWLLVAVTPFCAVPPSVECRAVAQFPSKGGKETFAQCQPCLYPKTNHSGQCIGDLETLTLYGAVLEDHPEKSGWHRAYV